MLHIPILRQGRPYESVDKTTIVHHATGEPVAEVSQANSGLIARDVGRWDASILDRFSMDELLAMCRRAADLFLQDELAVGDETQSFGRYIHDLSATTGMPHSYCHSNAQKVAKVLAEMETVLAGLTRGLDMTTLDRGYGETDGRTVSFFRQGRVFGAVLPSNSPGVHSLWIPAVALKTPVALKPGREEPWTPLRIIEALAAAGVPREAFGFYPTDHAGAAELLRVVDRAMLFGDSATTRPWQGDPRIEIHGPGISKILLGDDAAEDWERYLDLMESSIKANGGRSCINTSAIFTPKHGRAIAVALAERLAAVQALPADDPHAEIAAFANPVIAERISMAIGQGLRIPAAHDVTEQRRGSARLFRRDKTAYLLPTIVYVESFDERPAWEHPLARREYPFPFASVVECPCEEMPHAIGPTLIGTVIGEDPTFRATMSATPNIDRLNLGPIPTWRISWDQPHEGNLFELLYRQRAFQLA